MKNPVLFFCTLSLAAALMVACSRGDNQESPTPRSISFETYSAHLSHELVGSSDDYFADADIVYTDSVSMVIPSLVYGKEMSLLRDSILSLAFDTCGADVNKVIAEYVGRDARQFEYELKSTEQHDLLMSDGFGWVNGSVVNLTPSLLVYEVANSSMLPRAANGFSTKFYINYDIDSDSFINGDFVFAPDRRMELVEIISERAEEMVEKIGPTKVDALPERDNFYINTDGEIVFVYQPFEIASHAQGLISIPFYPAELAPYMTADAITYFNLGDLK